MASQEDPLISELRSRFRQTIKAISSPKPRWISVTIDRDGFLDFCKYVKEKNFEHCSCVSAVDNKSVFTIVYHLYNYEERKTLEITTDVPRDNPTIPSVTPLWGGANWHEREQYDFFGIIFENHPNLERIMTPPGWEYFPLRKEYRISGELQTSA